SMSDPESALSPTATQNCTDGHETPLKLAQDPADAAGWTLQLAAVATPPDASSAQVASAPMSHSRAERIAILPPCRILRILVPCATPEKRRERYGTPGTREAVRASDGGSDYRFGRRARASSHGRPA